MRLHKVSKEHEHISERNSVVRINPINRKLIDPKIVICIVIFIQFLRVLYPCINVGHFQNVFENSHFCDFISQFVMSLLNQK